MTESRQQFSSRFGVIMTFIGVAVGLGNVWRFPYMVAAFGGGAFLLLYLLILVGFGIPAIMAELTLGRMTRQGTLGTFTQIGMRGGSAVGWMLLLNGLPMLYHPTLKSERFARATDDRFFIVIEARDPKFARRKTEAFLDYALSV